MSSITADAGGVAIAIAVGGGGGGALSVGFAQATNTIRNTTTSDIDSSLATADGGVSISASSLASINALSYGGSGSFGAGSDVGVALAGAGAGVSNTVNDNIYAYILNCQNSLSYGVAATTGSVALSANDDPSIFSTAHGGSVAIGAGAAFAVGVAITAVQSFNTIMDTVESYIDNSLVTLHSGTGQVTLAATTPPSSQIESSGIAAAVGVSASEAGAGISGGGAGATNMITNTVEAYVGQTGVLSIPSTGSVTIQAISSQNAEADCHGYAVSAGLAVVAIGASVGTTTIDGTTQANMSGTLLAGHSLSVLATNNGIANDTIFALAGGIGFGGAGAGRDTINFNPTVNAYVDGRVGTKMAPFGGDVTVVATVLTQTHADAEGVAFTIGVAVGGATTRDDIGPKITTYIGGAAGLYATGSVSIESLLNYTATGTQITQNMGSTDKATTTSGDGGLLTGAGADSQVDGRSSSLDSSVHSGTTVSSADFVNLTMAYLNTDAEASSTAVGLLAGGEADANAYSDGMLNSHIDGTVDAKTFENMAVGFEHAYTNGVGYLIALGGLKVSTTAETSPTVSAALGTGATVTATGNAYNMSITEDDAAPNAKAIGIPIGAPDAANDQPTQTVELGMGATLTAGGSSVIEPYHNQYVVPTTFTVTNLGPNAAENPGNRPAKINSPSIVSVAPGELSVITVTAYDPRNLALSYSIIGGADANLFAIDPNTGELSFISEPASDGPFTVMVEADDNKGGAESQTITVSISSSTALAPGAQRLADGSFLGTVTKAQVLSMAAIAEAIWEATGLTAAQKSILDNINYTVTPLGNGAIGSDSGETVDISPDANSFGWFVDTSLNLATNPELASSLEYTQLTATSFSAQPGGDPAGGIDLLSLLLHEQGHALGLANTTSPSDLMYGSITEGMRWLPSAGEASQATPSSTLYTDYDPPAPGTSDSLASRGANYNRVVADKTSSNGVVNYVDVNANASPDINIVLGAGSVVSAGVGNVSLNVQSDNIATATGSALQGIPAPIAVVFADATVGGTINVSLAGTIMHQGDLTLELNTVNDAEANGDAMSAGPFGGTGVSTDAEVTPTIKTFVAPGSNINVTGNFAILTLSQSSATAVSNGIADSASLSVGVSLAKAVVAPTISTYIGAGATITAGGSITVETLQNEDINGNPTDNSATATAQASAGALIGSGTGAQATADDSPNVSAYVDQGATLSAGPNSPIVIQALANNVANANAGGVAYGGLLAAGASLATATTNGSTSAYLDGNVTQGGSLTVSASSVHDATATTTALAGGIASGTYNDSNASVNPSNTASIYDGNQVNVTDGVSVLSTSNDTANALTDGTQEGAVAIGISTSEATVSNTTSASLGNNVVIDAGSGDVNVQAQSTQAAISDGTASTGGIAAVGSTTATSMTTRDAAATIGDDTSITTNGNIAIASTNMTTGSDATTSNGTAGLIADSAPISSNTINTTSVATLGASDDLTSNLGNVTVLAVSNDTNDNATASAAGGGFVSLASPSTP